MLGFWHLASLDAPTVAVAWSLGFAWAGRVHLARWAPLLLALVTWSVYVIDRLLDTRAGLMQPARRGLRERHHFHWRYRRALLPMAIAAACAAAGIILVLMPPMARARDSVLAAAALAYFSGVHSGCKLRQFPLWWQRAFPGKELLVAVLFTAGCLLPAWHRPGAHRVSGSAMWAFWIPAGVFAAVAWLNLSAIARWESAGEDRPIGIALAEGRFRSQKQKQPVVFFAGILLGCGGLALAIAGAPAHLRPAALLGCGAASALLLAHLDIARARLSALTLRAAADLALLTPLLLLPLTRVLR